MNHVDGGEVLDHGSGLTDGSVKVRERLQELKLTDSDQPVLKKQKIEENGMALPAHHCGGESPEFLEPGEPEESCCICGEIAVGPYTSTCGHVFGSIAVKTFERESILTFPCPGKDFDNESCGEQIETSKLRPDRALSRTIQKKQVKCSNAPQGCPKIMMLKSLKSHLETDCQYAQVRCPNCTEPFPRHQIAEHNANCKSKTCKFAELGCGHVTSSDGKSTSASAKKHSTGLHMAFIIHNLSKVLAMARFSSKSAEETLNERSSSLTGQEELLRIMSNMGQVKSEAMQIEELRTNYVNKRVDTKNHLQNYNALLSQDFAVQVAEPVFRVRTRSQYLERQEEGTSEDVKKLLKDTIEIPILLNHGSIIFKVENFSEKRTKAIKGELKRGVHGPQFYTHEFGYLFVPILYPNGDGSGSGTHLSIFIAIKKGKYDSLLPWPVMGRITISVLSQKRVGREAVRHSFRTDVGALSYHRPTSDMNQASGIPKALELSLLKQPSDYLVDDTLFIQIVVEPKLP